MKTETKYYRVERSEIGFIRFIFEAYEGIAVTSTADDEKTVLALRIAPGCEEEVDQVLADLGRTIRFEALGTEARPGWKSLE